MIYIIILVWNGKKYLPNLFKSLENLNYSEKYKILVLDSASTDGSLEYLENLKKENKIELIKLNKNLGFTAGNNLGIQHALKNKAEYIYLLNQDTLVHPDFLNKTLEKIKSEKQIGIVQSLLLYYHDKNLINSWGNELHFLGYGYCGGNQLTINNQQLTVKEITYASFSGVLLKSELLKKIGLFDENLFSYSEDADLCLRAKLQNYKTVLAPNSIVYHDHTFLTDQRKVEQKKLRYYWMEKNRLYLILKFYKLKTLLLIWPIALVMDLGQFIFAIYRGYVGQWFKAHLWFIFNFYKLFKARQEIQRTRKIGDKELIKNFAAEIKYQPVSNPLLDKIGNPIMKVWWKMIKNII